MWGLGCMKYCIVVFFVFLVYFGWLRGGFWYRVFLKLVDEFVDIFEVLLFYKKKGKDNDEIYGKYIGFYNFILRLYWFMLGVEMYIFGMYIFRVFNVEILVIIYMYWNMDVC